MTQPSEESVIAAILGGLGAPVTSKNIQSLSDWIAIEQGGKWPPSASFNPMNTTQVEAGSTSFNSVGVQNYVNWSEGIQATDITLNNGRYSAIVSALKSGQGILSPSSAVQQELLVWSGNGYSSVAAGAATGGVHTGTVVPGIANTTGSTSAAGCFPNAMIVIILLPLLPVLVPVLWGYRAVQNRVKLRWNLPRHQRANRKGPRAAHNQETG